MPNRGLETRPARRNTCTWTCRLIPRSWSTASTSSGLSTARGRGSARFLARRSRAIPSRRSFSSATFPGRAWTGFTWMDSAGACRCFPPSQPSLLLPRAFARPLRCQRKWSAQRSSNGLAPSTCRRRRTRSLTGSPCPARQLFASNPRRSWFIAAAAPSSTLTARAAECISAVEAVARRAVARDWPAVAAGVMQSRAADVAEAAPRAPMAKLVRSAVPAWTKEPKVLIPGSSTPSAAGATTICWRGSRNRPPGWTSARQGLVPRRAPVQGAMRARRALPAPSADRSVEGQQARGLARATDWESPPALAPCRAWQPAAAAQRPVCPAWGPPRRDQRRAAR